MAGEVCLICGNKGEGYYKASASFKCTICGAVVGWEGAVAHYMKHVKYSGGDAICGVCNAKVKRDEARTHMRLHFIVGDGKRFFCGVCGREFISRKGALVHIMKAHEWTR
ncbi:MAG: hypothetical protein JZD41_02940 [Thermoproteus sp.]|nr:hypothetical protein [Thermoproteus sp.]